MRVSFLDLPRELRDMVYDHMADPTSTWFSDYISLYLSCHQIKAEIEEECGPVMETHLGAIRDSFDTGNFQTGSSLLSKQHPRFIVSRLDRKSDKHQLGFNLLGKMHFTSVTFVAQLPKKPRIFEQPMLDLMTAVFARTFNTKARRIVLDMYTVGKYEARAILKTSQLWFSRQYRYNVRWCIGKAGKVSAVWDHEDYPSTVEEPSLRLVEMVLQGLAAEGCEQ
jgi:hypothetical protein